MDFNYYIFEIGNFNLSDYCSVFIGTEPADESSSVCNWYKENICGCNTLQEAHKILKALYPNREAWDGELADGIVERWKINKDSDTI